MLNPGNDTVTIKYVNRTSGVKDRYGNILNITTATQGGCALQPIKEGDRVNETEYQNATDHCICPPTDVVAAIKAEDHIVYTPVGGPTMDYRVLGIKRFRDSWGRTSHYTLICRWEQG